VDNDELSVRVYERIADQLPQEVWVTEDCQNLGSEAKQRISLRQVETLRTQYEMANRLLSRTRSISAPIEMGIIK
jgi:hypothetical protein